MKLDYTIGVAYLEKFALKILVVANFHQHYPECM